MSFNVLAATKAAKFVVSGVVGLGAGKIMKQVIQNNTSPETLYDKVTMISGAWALGGLVGKASKKYSDEVIDDAVKHTTEYIEKWKLSAKLGRVNRRESTFEQEGLVASHYQRNTATGLWEKIPVAETI